MAMAQPTKVPIVAYHSVADEHDHLWSYLSLPVALFERQLRYLRRKGFTTVTLYDVHAYLHHGARLPPRAIALTFDDGYLDNWVHAFPLLKKYGMKATIFVATDFVDPFDGCRPTLEDVWAGRVARSALAWWGHVCWPELAAMQESGLIDVQAHTRTHTWYFAGDQIVDFHHPGDAYCWLDWNRSPDEKYSWLTRDHRATVAWGTPVYEFAQTLLRPRYFDDPHVTECATEYVANRGGATFFARPDWPSELRAAVSAYRSSAGCRGHFETDAEYVSRVRDEMTTSKQIIERRLNKPVDFLAWPCGDYTPRLQHLAVRECGYFATVNAQKTSNCPGDDPTELRRIGFGQDYIGPCQSDLIFMNFRGIVNYHSGLSHAYAIAPIARRLMRIGRLFPHLRGTAQVNGVPS